MKMLKLSRGTIIILWFVAVYVYVQPVDIQILISLSVLAILMTLIEIIYSKSRKYRIIRALSSLLIFIGMMIQMHEKFEEGLLAMPPSRIYLDNFLILNSACWSFVITYSFFMIRGMRT